MKPVAIGICLLMIASPPASAEEFLGKGGKFLASGDFAEAVKAYEAELKANGASAAALKGLGLAHYGQGDYGVGYNFEAISAAVSALNRSAALRPDAEVYYHLGLSYLILYDKAGAEGAHARLTGLDSALAGKLAEKIAAYVKPPSFNVARSGSRGGSPGSSGGDATSVAIYGNTVIVPVTISYRGTSVDANLVLDTGASVTTISERLAGRLGIQAAGTRAVVGVVADGRLVGARSFVAESMAVGPRRLAGVQTMVLPGSGTPVSDGLLGMNFLKNFKYHVDFRRKVIDWND